MANPVAPRQWEELKAAAPVLGIEPLLLDARSPDDLPRVFETAVAQRANAIVVGNHTAINTKLAQFVELAARHRLPATYLAREFVDAGGLMMYGVNYPDLYRRAATFVEKSSKAPNPPSCRSSSRSSSSYRQSQGRKGARSRHSGSIFDARRRGNRMNT